MAVERILAEIDKEIEHLERIKAMILNSPENAGSLADKPRRGRPRKDAAAAAAPAKAAKGARKKRNLSAEARKRIADAQKRRWAEKKKAAA